MIDIQSDGITVWVHIDGETVARFGRLGIDIHRPISDQLLGASPCLACTHSRTTTKDWESFLELIKKYYSVELKEEHTPDRFRILG